MLVLGTLTNHVQVVLDLWHTRWIAIACGGQYYLAFGTINALAARNVFNGPFYTQSTRGAPAYPSFSGLFDCECRHDMIGEHHVSPLP